MSEPLVNPRSNPEVVRLAESHGWQAGVLFNHRDDAILALAYREAHCPDSGCRSAECVTEEIAKERHRQWMRDVLSGTLRSAQSP